MRSQQEDLVAQAYLDGDAKGGSSLRAVALMHNSPIGIMVRKASGITELSMIRQGVVNMGNRGSGFYANATAVLKAMNLDERDLAKVTYLPPTEFEREFCGGRVDVIFDALAHPSDLYRRLRACGGEFLDIPPDIMQKMTANNKWLRPMDIAAGMYDPQQQQVKTLGMRNLLISNSQVDEEAIFRVAGLIKSQLQSMQRSHPGVDNHTRPGFLQLHTTASTAGPRPGSRTGKPHDRAATETGTQGQPQFAPYYGEPLDDTRETRVQSITQLSCQFFPSSRDTA